LMVKRGNFNQRSRRVYLTGGCTGRFTKTLKMVKSGQKCINKLSSSLVGIFRMGWSVIACY
jgi:hypothetical protein